MRHAKVSLRSCLVVSLAAVSRRGSRPSPSQHVPGDSGIRFHLLAPLKESNIVNLVFLYYYLITSEHNKQHCNSKRRLEALINRTILFPTKLQRFDRCLQACEGSTAPGW